MKRKNLLIGSFLCFLITGFIAYQIVWADPPTPMVSGLTSSSNVTITGGSVTGLTELGADTITDGTLTISGGNLTTPGTVSAGTLTDGTLSISNGIISGAIDLTATGTITSSILTDGTLSINAGNLTTTGTVSAGTLTDGTVSINSGIISDVIDITASGTVQGGTLTDGTLSITDGDLTTTGTVSAGILTDGTLSISGGDLTTTGTITGYDFSGITAGMVSGAAATADLAEDLSTYSHYLYKDSAGNIIDVVLGIGLSDSSGTLSFNGVIGTDFIPNADNAYYIGTNTNSFKGVKIIDTITGSHYVIEVIDGNLTATNVD